MQRFMFLAGNPVPHLDNLEFLEKTPVWDEAMRYLSQKNLPKKFPAFEMKTSAKHFLIYEKGDPLRSTLDALIAETKGETP